MKARIKATGEVVEVKIHYPEFERPYFTLVDSDGVTRFSSEDLEPAEPDWQQVRIDAAVKLTCALSKKMLGAGYSERQFAKQAVELADALVAELKKGGSHADIQQ